MASSSISIEYETSTAITSSTLTDGTLCLVSANRDFGLGAAMPATSPPAIAPATRIAPTETHQRMAALPSFHVDGDTQSAPRKAETRKLSFKSSIRYDNTRGRRQEVADRFEKGLRRLQLRDMRAAGNDFQARLRQESGEFVRHRRRRGLIMFADHDEHGHLHFGDLASQIELRERITGGTEHVRIGSQKGFAAIAHQIRMLRLELRREQPAHRDIGDGRKTPGAGSGRHVEKRLASGFGERR